MERRIAFTLGTLLVVGVEDHIFTSFLSSPASIRTFYADDPQKANGVLKDARLALVFSVGTSAFAAWGLKDWRVFAIGSLTALALFYSILRKGNILQKPQDLLDSLLRPL
jgi:choline-glycine betaine transporter